MTSIQPIRTEKNNSIKDLLAADAVGASAALCTDYWLQKDAFKSADRFIPVLKEQSAQLAQKGVETNEIEGLIKYLGDKKVSNFALFCAALKGAAVAGLMYVGYKWIKNTAGKKDKNFEEKTATAAGLGAVGGGLASYFSQKSILNSVSSLRNSVQDVLVATAAEGSDEALKPLTNSFKQLTTAIGDGKVMKSSIAHGALRGAAYVGSAYVLYRGIKALFNRKPQPKIQVIAISDDAARELFKNSKTKPKRVSEEIIDI